MTIDNHSEASSSNVSKDSVLDFQEVIIQRLREEGISEKKIADIPPKAWDILIKYKERFLPHLDEVIVSRKAEDVPPRPTYNAFKFTAFIETISDKLRKKGISDEYLANLDWVFLYVNGRKLKSLIEIDNFPLLQAIQFLHFRRYIENKLEKECVELEIKSNINVSADTWEFLFPYARELQKCIDAEIISARQVVSLLASDINTLTQPKIVDFLLAIKQSLIPIIGEPPFKKAFLYNLEYKDIRRLINNNTLSLAQAIKLTYRERKKLIADYQANRAIVLQEGTMATTNAQVLIDKDILSLNEYEQLDEALKLRLSDDTIFRAYVWLLNQGFTINECFALEKQESLVDFLHHNPDPNITLRYLSQRLADGRDSYHDNHQSTLQSLLSFWHDLSNDEKIFFSDLINHWYEFINDHPIKMDISTGGSDEALANDGERTFLSSVITLCRRWQRFPDIDLFIHVYELLSAELKDKFAQLNTKYGNNKIDIFSLWWLSTITDQKLYLLSTMSSNEIFKAMFNSNNMSNQDGNDADANKYARLFFDLLFAREMLLELFFNIQFLTAIFGIELHSKANNLPIEKIQFIFELKDEQILRLKNRYILNLIAKKEISPEYAIHISEYHLLTFENDQLMQSLERLGLTDADVLQFRENELRNVSNPTIQSFILKKYMTIEEAKNLEYFQYHLLSQLPQNYDNIGRIKQIIAIDFNKYCSQCAKRNKPPILSPVAQSLCDYGLLTLDELLSMSVTRRKAFEQPELWEWDTGFIKDKIASLFYLREYSQKEIDALTPENVRENCADSGKFKDKINDTTASVHTWKNKGITLLPLVSMFFGKNISLPTEQPNMTSITFNSLTSSIQLIPFLSTAMLSLLAIYLCYKIISYDYSLSPQKDNDNNQEKRHTL
jgi:hypothetical protein